eukprot:5291832-Prorocentrum_lima.AAC.1
MGAPRGVGEKPWPGALWAVWCLLCTPPAHGSQNTRRPHTGVGCYPGRPTGGRGGDMQHSRPHHRAVRRQQLSPQ